MPRHSPLRELYLARIRDVYRQPARIFWVYGFPTVLAIGLGLAFRSRPQEIIHAELVRNAASDGIEKAIREDAPRARREDRPVVIVNVVPLEEALHRLRTGKTPLVIEPDVSR